MPTLTETITYRLLPEDEWPKLQEFIGEQFPIPSPAVASCAVAEQDGQIVGCLFLQLALHLEPLILSSPEASFKRLAEFFNSGLHGSGTEYFAFAPNAKIARMCEINGMEPMPYMTYRKQLKGGD